MIFYLDDVAEVESLIKNDANLVNFKYPTHENWTPLHNAAAGGELFKTFVVKREKK